MTAAVTMEGGKESDHRGVGGGLSEVVEVVATGAVHGALEEMVDALEIVLWAKRRRCGVRAESGVPPVERLGDDSIPAVRPPPPCFFAKSIHSMIVEGDFLIAKY